MEALHLNRTLFKDLLVDSSWLSLVVNDIFLDHSLSLWPVYGDEASRCKFVMARPHDVFCLDWCRHSWLMYWVKALLADRLLVMIYQALTPIIERVTSTSSTSKGLLRWHHLCASRERLLFLRKLFHNFTEVNHFICLNGLRWQLVIKSLERLSRCTELREAIVDHLLTTVDINSTHLMELVDPLLRHSFIEMFLLGTKVSKIMIDFRQRCRLFVHFLISGLAFWVNAEATVHSVRDWFDLRDYRGSMILDRYGIEVIFRRHTFLLYLFW